MLEACYRPVGDICERPISVVLTTNEPIAEAQTDSSRTTHRHSFVPLKVVRIELNTRVGQVLPVDLYEPSALSSAERSVICSERRQIVSHGPTQQIERQLIGRSEGM